MRQVLNLPSSYGEYHLLFWEMFPTKKNLLKRVTSYAKMWSSALTWFTLVFFSPFFSLFYYSYFATDYFTNMSGQKGSWIIFRLISIFYTSGNKSPVVSYCMRGKIYFPFYFLVLNGSLGFLKKRQRWISRKVKITIAIVYDSSSLSNGEPQKDFKQRRNRI